SVEFVVEPTVERLLGPRARQEAHITDPLRGRIRRCSPEGIAFAQRAMAARPDSAGQLPAVDVPVLVVSGRDDVVIPAADVQAMTAALRGSLTVELECGHLSNLELPHEFSRVVGEFLDGVPSR
ncbi:MAG TPA: alpha/beta hydrolase, partial [Candidatus Dormibacteraeota bacterium]|nr:alpha/beta hydrolase [Candidatus Dormibacteraeota bacterium]